jgi:hypothetical protein
MKKIKILLLGIVSVFLLLGTAFAIEATPADREAIEKVCQQYLLDYNATRLLGKAPAADYFAAGTAAEYQMKKLELQRQETMLAHQQVPVEKIIEERFTVQEIAMNGDGAEVKAAFACTYRYALDPNTFEGVGLDSEYGEGFCFRLLRQNGQWLICDIASTDDYDYIYRSRLKARERFDPITEELLTDMDTAIQAAHEMQLDVSQVTKNSITPSSPNSTNLFLDDLDTNAMSSYAYDNASKVSPSSGDGITPYYDFSLITGNHDCTNFISHCLLAGGASKNVSANGWYYNTLSDRTPSWSNVNYLHNFLVRNSSTRGPKGVSSEYPAGNSLTSLYSSCRIGDLIQIKYNGASNYGHSTIVTGKDFSQTTILITSRTSQNSYNKSAVLTKVYNSNRVKSYRLVDLEGNYTG